MSGSAQSSPSPAAGLSSPQSAQPKPDSEVGGRLYTLEQEVRDLKKPPKDIWDKLTSISGLVSGSLVVLVGLFVTYVLNERNRVTAEQQKQRELAVLQVQTVQSFMPQLQSGGPKEVEAALLAIFALDTNSPLATDLAGLYRNEGSINALRKIASGPDAESAKRAQQTLASMVTVSFKHFSRETDDLRLSVSALRTFYDLTNQVFWALKGVVEAFTYEKTWILRDKATLKEFKKKRSKDGALAPFDLRSLEEIGITPGMTLEVMPMKTSADESQPQLAK